MKQFPSFLDSKSAKSLRFFMPSAYPDAHPAKHLTAPPLVSGRPFSVILCEERAPFRGNPHIARNGMCARACSSADSEVERTFPARRLSGPPFPSRGTNERSARTHSGHHENQ